MSDQSALAVMRGALTAATTGTAASREVIDLLADLSARLGVEAVADALRLVVAFHPGAAGLLKTGANINFSRERWNEAADLARWAVAAGDSTSDGHMVAAAFLFRARRFDEARRHCVLAETLAPNTAGPLFIHGRVLMALDRAQEGLHKIDQAARIDAKFGFAAQVLHLGLTALDFDRAKADLVSISASKPATMLA